MSVSNERMRELLEDVRDRYPGRADAHYLVQRLGYSGMGTNEFLEYMRREDGTAADRKMRERFAREAAIIKDISDKMFPW